MIIPEFYSKFIKYRVKNGLANFLRLLKIEKQSPENVARFLIKDVITARFMEYFSNIKLCLCVACKII